MYYFIVNPASGCGRGRKIWKAILAKLQRRSVQFHPYVLRYPGEATEIAGVLSKLNHDYTAVIIGGDGTINEFVNGLTSFEHITMACIPTGSGNDFVRGLGLEKNPDAALSYILNPKQIRRIKIGTVRFGDKIRSFAVSSGLGFDAAVCDGILQSGMKKFLNWFHAGKLVYLAIALKMLLKLELHRFSVTLDDCEELTFDRAFFAAAMNLRYEGGGFMFGPQADPEDDRFQFCITHEITRRRIFHLLPLAFSGRHAGKKGVYLASCQKAVFRIPEPMCIHTDGEIFGYHNEVTYEARPGRLSVITG